MERVRDSAYPHLTAAGGPPCNTRLDTPLRQGKGSPPADPWPVRGSPMPTARFALLLPLFLAGCALSPAHLVERPAIERCLPSDVKMGDYVEHGPVGMRVTVGEKLARLGAT